MNLHLDPHHVALNSLLAILRERGGVGLAGQLMQLHPKNDWGGMRELAATLEATHPDIDIQEAAQALMEALDTGPLSSGWVPPEMRAGSGS